MTIISILIAFALCHFVRELRQLRRFGWFESFTKFCNDNLAKLPGWNGITGFLILLGLPLLAAYLVDRLMFSTLGQIGEFLLAIVMLVYTFGPRDLDIDVRKVIRAENQEEQTEALETLLDGPVPEEKSACQTAAINAVF